MQFPEVEVVKEVVSSFAMDPAQQADSNNLPGEPELDKKQHLYKIVVIGDYAVGKTSFIKRYCEGYFTPNYKLTIGVDFAVKEIDWDESTQVTLQLWDVAGHERFGTMTRVYYKYAIAAILVFDLSRPSTFDAVAKWREDLNSKVALADGTPIPAILLANKCDVAGVKIDREKLDQYCKENEFLAWFETSAKENTNVDIAMMTLVEKVLEVAKSNAMPQPENNVVQLNSRPEPKEQACCLNGF